VPLAAAIAAGGIPCVSAPRLERDLWAKLLYNAGLNPLGALTDATYGALAERSETRQILDSVMDEVFSVMLAEGAETHWPDAETYRSHFYADLLPPTAAHESSMLQDIRAGRSTEIEALSGEVARRGEARGVPTPVCEALATLVRSIERAPAA
jgi:2-dehydropantoate 2-reductase